MFKRIIGSSIERPSCWVLHGLLGQGRNWLSVATTLSKLSHMQFVLLDLRNHGRSHGFAAPHTMTACVDDLVGCGRQLMHSPAALIGHSLGGKVLLQLARSPDAIRELSAHQHPNVNTNLKLFIVDSFPGALSHTKRSTTDGIDGVFEVLDFVRNAPPIIPSKKWLISQCASRGISNDVALWLASNVTEVPSGREPHGGELGLRWMFDPVGAAEMFDSHNSTDCWDVLLDGPVPGVDIHFVMASRSSRWHDAATCARIDDVARAQSSFAASIAGGAPARRGNIFLYTVNAGHWVHADNPTALTNIISHALQAPAWNSV
jgi:pimeloyl-ACP methyl ester carboxylesterase